MNPLFAGVQERFYGIELVPDESLVGSKTAKDMDNGRIAVSPAMFELITDGDEEQLQLVMENLWVKP